MKIEEMLNDLEHITRCHEYVSNEYSYRTADIDDVRENYEIIESVGSRYNEDNSICIEKIHNTSTLFDYFEEYHDTLKSTIKEKIQKEIDNKIKIAKSVEKANLLSSIIEEDDMEVISFIIARKVIKTIGENQCNDYNFLELDKEIIRVYQEELQTRFKPDLENLSTIRAICLDYIYRGV